MRQLKFINATFMNTLFFILVVNALTVSIVEAKVETFEGIGKYYTNSSEMMEYTKEQAKLLEMHKNKLTFTSKVIQNQKMLVFQKMK